MEVRKGDDVIRTLDDWERLAGPKSAVQWKDYRSAKECARAWMERGGSPGIPHEVVEVLASHSDFGDLTEWEAEPEALVRFDGYGGPANIDVMVAARDDRGGFVVAIEAKADESFGPTVDRALAAAVERGLQSPKSRGVKRIQELVASQFRAVGKGQPRLYKLRYQLLTATAAALAEAERVEANRAVVFVHEFETPATQPANHTRNRNDLLRFLTRIGITSPERVLDGQMVGPVSVPGSSIPLYVGKATTVVAERT